jgi:murein DD-endopeptidase MepM/ murein hydrolase activator NlpD
MGRAIMPVSSIPQWGEMTTANQWNAAFAEMKKRPDIHFGPVPPYNRALLTTPMAELLNPRDSAGITQKLFYSTRFMGEYDLDADEHTGTHVGVDLKLPLGQGFGSIAGGRVHRVSTNERLGLHIIIEHRTPNGNTYYSIYGHCGSAAVQAGQDVEAGEYIGTVGMTGQTSAPHLHLQVDLARAGEATHVPFTTTTPGDISQYSIDPLQFIRQY